MHINVRCIYYSNEYVVVPPFLTLIHIILVLNPDQKLVYIHDNWSEELYLEARSHAEMIVNHTIPHTPPILDKPVKYKEHYYVMYGSTIVQWWGMHST